MKLLIVAATHLELKAVLQHFNLPQRTFIEHDKFDILITGVGMTATAFSLGKYLNSKYNLVLNVGIAGSFNPDIPLGSVVNVETDIFAELGAEDHDQFLTINDLGFGENTYHATYQVDDLRSVKAITVNKVHGSLERIAFTRTLFDVELESMEGAAVFYACSYEQINCAQVRSISNYVEPRNRENWQIGLAVKNLNDWLVRFILDLRS